MTDNLKNLLMRYVSDIHGIYESSLMTVILYGSYARGDFHEGSDIDIMILVDLNDVTIKEKQSSLSDLTFDYNFDNDIEIMPIVENVDHFNKWLRAYPFYNNVKREGIELYAA